MFELAGMGLVAAMMGDRAWGEMGVCVQDEAACTAKVVNIRAPLEQSVTVTDSNHVTHDLCCGCSLLP